MNTSAASSQAPRGRVQLLLLATLFFFPLLISYGLYYLFPQFQPEDKVNYGELVDPARPQPEMQLVEAGPEAGESPGDETLFRGRWTYIVRAGSRCDQACLRALVMVRQVRLAMNEKRSRIQRVLVLSDPAAVETVAAELASEHPDLRVVAETTEVAVLDTFLQPAGAAIHLSDPLGNWMMFYPELTETQTDFKGLQKDIKRLLRLSVIG